MEENRRIQENELVQLLKMGNEKAFSIVFHQYKELLFRHAFRILQNMDDAEDVVQELFVKLWEKRAAVPEDVVLSAYLYTMTRNLVLNKLSRDKVISRYLDHALYFDKASDNTTENFILEKELAEIIELEIAKLPERMRLIFTLHRREGLSHKEIAELLNITEGTSKLQVSKALKVLRDNLAATIILLTALVEK